MSVTARGTMPIQLQTKEKPMPYASQKQRKFFNANRKKLEKQGVDVGEWNQSSKGLNLPVRAGKKMMKKGKK